jgi:hypothetical protein
MITLIAYFVIIILVIFLIKVSNTYMESVMDEKIREYHANKNNLHT